jgi:hypothetical protein
MFIYLDESGDLGFDFKKKGTSRHFIINSPDGFRKRVFQRLAEQDVFILALCLNKNKILERLHEKKDKLYNYVTGLLFDKILNIAMAGEELIMTVDKVKVGRLQIDDFNFYLGMKLQLAGQDSRGLKIIHADSQKDRCIQAVDFISGALFRKYEFRDLGYYNLIRGRIKSDVFWPK